MHFRDDRPARQPGRQWFFVTVWEPLALSSNAAEYGSGKTTDDRWYMQLDFNLQQRWSET